MKAVVAAFNQEKALVGAFSVITNLRMELFEALVQSVVTIGSSIITVTISIKCSWSVLCVISICLIRAQYSHHITNKEAINYYKIGLRLF